MKKCAKCNTEKEDEAFSKVGRLRNRLGSYCKACRCVLSAEWKQRNKEWVKEYQRDVGITEKRRRTTNRWHHTPEGIASRKAANVRYHAKNREKTRAHVAVWGAVYSGILIKEPCRVCRSLETVEAHHEDYSKPLDVVWLCDFHHKERHKEIRENGRLNHRLSNQSAN